MSSSDKPSSGMKRRDFLKSVAVSTVAVATTATVPGVIRTASASDPIRVGVLLSLTGAWTAYGFAQLHGLELAVDEINESGGVLGRRIELVVADTKTQPRVVAQQANKR